MEYTLIFIQNYLTYPKFTFNRVVVKEISQLSYQSEVMITKLDGTLILSTVLWCRSLSPLPYAVGVLSTRAPNFLEVLFYVFVKICGALHCGF